MVLSCCLLVCLFVVLFFVLKPLGMSLCACLCEFIGYSFPSRPDVYFNNNFFNQLTAPRPRAAIVILGIR